MSRFTRVAMIVAVAVSTLGGVLHASDGKEPCSAQQLTITIDLVSDDVPSVVISASETQEIEAFNSTWDDPSQATGLRARWSELHARQPSCTDRWITDPDQVHKLTVLVHSTPGSGTLEIKFTETKRKTRLAGDIATLIKLIPALRGDLRTATPSQFARCVYVLTEKRANLEILVSETESDGKTKELAKPSLVTGPAEHWALSANAVLNQVKEVKVTDDNTLDVKETPDKFLIGLDYYFGDLISDWGGSSFAKNLGLKLLVEASSRPGNRLGLALTYRGGAGPLSFELMSPFAGVLWSRSTELDAGGKVLSRGGLEGPEWVVGLSFNLDRALEWLKPNKQGS